MIETINEYKAHVDKIYKKLCTFIGESIVGEEGIITSIREPEITYNAGSLAHYSSKVVFSTGHMRWYTYSPYIVDVECTDCNLITLFKKHSGELVLNYL